MTDMMVDTDGLDQEEVARNLAAQDLLARAITNLKGTFSFECTTSRGEYSNSDKRVVGLHTQFDFAPEATPEEFLAKVQEVALQSRAAVYEQAGIEAHLDESGILREVVQDAFPGAQVVHGEQSPVRQAPAGDDMPPYTDERFDGLTWRDAEFKRMETANRPWAEARYEVAPHEFFDNTADKASGKRPRGAPDYVHKKHRHSTCYKPKS